MENAVLFDLTALLKLHRQEKGVFHLCGLYFTCIPLSHFALYISFFFFLILQSSEIQTIKKIIILL